MGSLRKQSKQMQNENSNSPLQVFGGKESNSKSPSKNSAKSKMLNVYTDANEKPSSLKMRMFESPESPQKHVADLGKQLRLNQNNRGVDSLSKAISDSRIA